MRVKKGHNNAIEIWSDGPADTEKLGVILGGMLQPGDLFFLSGDLGSGKTLLVRGVTVGINSEELATSPTFALIHRYEGELPLYHIDLYRLSGPEEIEPLALEELMEEKMAMMIEWGEPAKEVLPSSYMEIEFFRGEHDNQRKISFLPFGERYRMINHLLLTKLIAKQT